MTVVVNEAAIQVFMHSPQGPAGLMIAARTEAVLVAARSNVSHIMARAHVPAESLVDSKMDEGIYGVQGHVGTVGSGSMAKYLAAKENREHVWLTPAIKSAGFVER